MRASLIVGGLLLLPATSAMADLEVDWTVTPPETGEVVGDEVHIEGAGTRRLLTLDDTGIEVDLYVVRGTVRFDDVAGTRISRCGACSPGGGAFFSRTLADFGPMAALSGDSSGRGFELPFLLDGASRPERVELNLVLPEGGEVWIGSLELGGSPTWWNARQSGALGATVGSQAGIMGAVVGILASRRRGRRLVSSLLVVAVALGVAAAVAGVVALIVSQSFHVWISLLLIGVVLTTVSGVLLVVLDKAYAAAELHRIHALDTDRVGRRSPRQLD